jgi:hypothetical protein
MIREYFGKNFIEINRAKKDEKIKEKSIYEKVLCANNIKYGKYFRNYICS